MVDAAGAWVVAAPLAEVWVAEVWAAEVWAAEVWAAEVWAAEVWVVGAAVVDAPVVGPPGAVVVRTVVGVVLVPAPDLCAFPPHPAATMANTAGTASAAPALPTPVFRGLLGWW
ncbi:MAG: hypothetical protein ACLQVK_02630 [Acidimicrobiales bacterium]